MAVQPHAKVYTQEELDAQIKKAQDAERRKYERSAAPTWEITAPVADPNHAVWQERDAEGKLSNPYSPDYAREHGTFTLQVHPFTTRDGQQYEGSTVAMFNGRGVTSDENIARWIKSYYGYEVAKLSTKDDTQRALELVG